MIIPETSNINKQSRASLNKIMINSKLRITFINDELMDDNVLYIKYTFNIQFINITRLS